jgi:hypothetical protein
MKPTRKGRFFFLRWRHEPRIASTDYISASKSQGVIGNAWGDANLPVLIEYFDLMEAIIRQGAGHPKFPRMEREKMGGGYAKIALDNYSFAMSELGLEMVDVVNRFVEEAQVREEKEK